MATVKIYDQHKQEAGEIFLAPEIFEVQPRAEILNFVVRSQRAARRAGTHSAKTRAFVSGGGVKPWKQKGTGRARAGSNRSPVWRGGAIIFGPTPRKYGFKVNRKVRALALKMALSDRLATDSLMIVDKIELAEAKTRLFAGVADALGLQKALIVLPESDNTLELASRNIPDIELITEAQLNVLGIMKHERLVLLKDTVKLIEARFGAEGA